MGPVVAVPIKDSPDWAVREGAVYAARGGWWGVIEGILPQKFEAVMCMGLCGRTLALTY